jgi:hypothetical protein|tara:strand:- start:705 stop:905 length:201 start_codon:yes stop_codon:yes gene_type:complete
LILSVSLYCILPPLDWLIALCAFASKHISKFRGVGGDNHIDELAMNDGKNLFIWLFLIIAIQLAWA